MWHAFNPTNANALVSKPLTLQTRSRSRTRVRKLSCYFQISAKMEGYVRQQCWDSHRRYSGVSPPPASKLQPSGQAAELNRQSCTKARVYRVNRRYRCQAGDFLAGRPWCIGWFLRGRVESPLERRWTSGGRRKIRRLKSFQTDDNRRLRLRLCRHIQTHSWLLASLEALGNVRRNIESREQRSDQFI